MLPSQWFRHTRRAIDPRLLRNAEFNTYCRAGDRTGQPCHAAVAG